MGIAASGTGERVARRRGLVALALFLLALAVRIGGLQWAHADAETAARRTTPDSLRVYLPIAANLTAGLGFVLAHDVTAPLTVAPVYPLWLASLHELAGPPEPWLVGLAQALLRSFAVIAVFGIGLRVLPPAAAAGAAGLYALDPWEAYWTPFVLKESIAVPLLLVALGAALRAREARTPASALAAGASGAVATLAWFGAAVLVAWSGWTLARGGSAGRRLAALAACGAAPVLGLWLALVVSPIPEYGWLHAPFRAFFKFVSRPLAPEAPIGGYPPVAVNTAVSDLREAARGGPGDVLALVLERLPRNLGRSVVNLGRPVETQSAPVVSLVFGGAYVLLVALALAGWRIARRDGRELAALPTLFAGLVLLLVLVGGGVRQRQYLTPLLALPAGLALARCASVGASLAIRLSPRRFGERPSAAG